MATQAATDWVAIASELGGGFEEGAAERDEQDTFVGEHYELLKDRGMLSALVPAEFGGGGASYGAMAEVLRVLGRCEPSTALALSMHQHLVAFQLYNHRHGRPAPLLPRVVGERLVLVSTGARDWLESNGSTVRVEDGFRVTARKAFASGSPAGNLLLTSAPYEDPSAGWQVLHFAVPLTAAGVSVGDDWRVHGMRATGSQTVSLDDVFVPDAAVSLRRPRGAWHDVWSTIATVALPLVMGVYVGVAERASELALSFARSNPSAPELQWTVGEMRSSLAVARVCWSRMVELVEELEFEPSLERTDETLMMKSQVAAQTLRTVERAMEASAGRGFYRRSGIERLLRDVRAAHYHPLPEKEQVRFSGRFALGLDPVEIPG
ncbi:MAG: acyl-CoA/acyl-ACP dehydrogenase [Dehalococcoidia bacterium]|nr:acyl-CoA/acyl-ACP dehydrogenase [Dehalococcoidia bacterium]